MERPIEASIRRKLEDGFSPVELQVINESHMHAGPPNRETHFKVVIVGDAFAGKARVMRHRAVNRALAAELEAGVHALSIQAWTPDEFTARGGVIPDSPLCRGGSKAEG